MRWASIVLPAPGGPTNSRWCPPAAATSSASRAIGWPRTSARSGTGGSSVAGAGGSIGPRRTPAEHLDQVASRSTQRTSPSAATRASSTLAAGTTASTAPSAPTIGATPGTGRIEPSSPSSPTKPRSRTASGGTCSQATSMPTAIARSSPEPPLRWCDGARLTVIRFVDGHGAAATAPRRGPDRATRGRPRRAGRRSAKAGRPVPTWTSTVTGSPVRRAAWRNGRWRAWRPPVGRSTERGGDRRDGRTGPTTADCDMVPPGCDNAAVPHSSGAPPLTGRGRDRGDHRADVRRCSSRRAAPTTTVADTQRFCTRSRRTSPTSSRRRSPPRPTSTTRSTSTATWPKSPRSRSRRNGGTYCSTSRRRHGRARRSANRCSDRRRRLSPPSGRRWR